MRRRACTRTWDDRHMTCLLASWCACATVTGGPSQRHRSGGAQTCRRRLLTYDMESSAPQQGRPNTEAELALFRLWCYLTSWLSARISRWSQRPSPHRYRGVLLQIHLVKLSRRRRCLQHTEPDKTCGTVHTDATEKQRGTRRGESC